MTAQMTNFNTSSMQIWNDINYNTDWQIINHELCPKAAIYIRNSAVTCTLENNVTIWHIPNISNIIFSTSYSKRLSRWHIYAEDRA